MPRLFRAPQQVAADSAVFFPEFEKRAPRPDRFAQNVGMADTLTKLATGPLGEAAMSLGKNVKWGLSDLARQYRDQKAAEARGGAGDAEFLDVGQEQSPFIGRDTTGEKVNVAPYDARNLNEQAQWSNSGIDSTRREYDPYRNALASRTQLREELKLDPFQMPASADPLPSLPMPSKVQPSPPLGMSLDGTTPPTMRLQGNPPSPFDGMKFDRGPIEEEDSVDRDVRFLNRMADVLPNVTRFYGSTPETTPEGRRVLADPAAGGLNLSAAEANEAGAAAAQAPQQAAVQPGGTAAALAPQVAASAATARPKTLGTATDEQLRQARAKLADIVARNSTDEVAKQRLSLVDQELGYRTYQGEREPEPLTEAQWIAQAAVADTPQKQAALLGQIDNVRTPYANVMGMIGTGEHDRLLKLAEGSFPSAPRKTPEQIAAEIALAGSKADAQAAAAERSRAEAERLAALTPAQRALLEQQGDLAGAGAGLKRKQTVTEERRPALVDAQARAANVGADDKEATRAARIAKLQADTARLNAAAAKARRVSAGGGRLSADELKEAKVLTGIAKEHIAAARAESKDALDVLRQQEREAEMARMRAQSVPDAGDPPAAVPENAPTDLKVQNAKAAEAWRKLNAAKVGAEQEAARQQVLVDRQRGMVDQTLAAEKEAMKAAEPWQARAAEMGDRYAKKRGIVQPAPQEPSFMDKAGQFLRSLPAPAPAAAPAPSGKVVL